ncbi:MAG: hypothetical protein WDN45_16905 [Caulobacteraceae bacterium]
MALARFLQFPGDDLTLAALPEGARSWRWRKARCRPRPWPRHEPVGDAERPRA